MWTPVRRLTPKSFIALSISSEHQWTLCGLMKILVLSERFRSKSSAHTVR